MERGVLVRNPWASDNFNWASEAFNNLLPGGHACVFGTHRTALEAEDVGFEVRDCLTVLGPQIHRVWLFRRPCHEATVAAQMLATGTGALCIDACRIYTDWQEPDRPESWKRSGFTAKPDAEKIAAPPGKGINLHPQGRWPANLVLVHTSECMRVGTTKVKGHAGYPNGPGGKSFQYSSAKRGAEVRPNAWAGHADADGLETIPAWQCPSVCPVLALDAQSGVLKNGGQNRTSTRGLGLFDPERVWGGVVGSTSFPGDLGGASRFFSQFANEDELDDWLLRLILG